MRKINLEKERHFENQKQIDINIRKNQSKYYWATEISIKKHNKMTCKKIKDKNVLEIGCSNGNDAILYSKFFKSYLGLDISDEAINKAKALNLNNASFRCIDGHKIPSENKEFDCVIVNSLLHHLDLPKVFKEIHRVLKPNGFLIFREPLGINPLFKIYRKFTTSARTDDERPFQLCDIKIMQKYFDLDEVQYFGLLSNLSAFFRINLLRKTLTIVDHYLSKTFLKYYFWQFSGFAKKK